MSPDDERHGTNAGWAAHRYDGEDPCAACREAHNRATRHWQYAKQRGEELTVDSIGVRRRVYALHRLGWTDSDIAVVAGWKDGRNVRHVLASARCLLRTHERICKAYDELSMQVAPPSLWATRIRNKAARDGWPPPLFYDDDSIDAPEYVPQSADTTEAVDTVVVERILAGDWHLSANRAERLEVIARWSGALNELERRTGWNVYRERREVA